MDKQPNPFTSAVPVEIQDQHSDPIDLYICRDVLTTNPTSSIALNAKSINLASVTGAVVGDCLEIIENGKVFQAIVQTIVSLTITFNCPVDQAFTTAAVVTIGKWNMNVDGSVTPLIYDVGPPAGVQWDINRIMVGVTDNAAMDDSLFGGLPSLTNGVVVRVKDGYYKNLFVVNDNGGWRERCYDAQYLDKAPAGSYGF